MGFSGPMFQIMNLLVFNICIAKMEVECLKHPGASTIGSSKVKTAPMAGKSWEPSHEHPHHAKGPQGLKAMASSERMGLMAECWKTTFSPRADTAADKGTNF